MKCTTCSNGLSVDQDLRTASGRRAFERWDGLIELDPKEVLACTTCQTRACASNYCAGCSRPDAKTSLKVTSGRRTNTYCEGCTVLFGPGILTQLAQSNR